MGNIALGCGHITVGPVCRGHFLVIYTTITLQEGSGLIKDQALNYTKEI